MRKSQVFPFLKKGDVFCWQKSRMFRHNTMADVHISVILSTFLSFGQIYRRNKSDRLEVLLCVYELRFGEKGT